MVGNEPHAASEVMPPPQQEIDLGQLGERLNALPGVARLRDAAQRSGIDAYLVGGSVRDALLGLVRADLDVAVEGDHLAFARELGGDVRAHPAFLTATAATPDGPIDVATARTETYPNPGALPVVSPASLAEDLDRRDFTINAIAIPLRGEPELLDPHDGLADLRAKLLRVLHRNSFVDDPTRALRAARYASRLGLELEAETETLLRAADLGTVSAERVDAELRLLAGEGDPAAGFRLLAEWGLLALDERAPGLVAAVVRVASRPPWAELGAREAAVLAALRGSTERALGLASANPQRPSEEVDAAHGHGATDLLLARALGAEWLDRYLEHTRHVRLEISGHDLLAAGLEPGPAIGAGLAAALRAKLDGEATGREAELDVAIATARHTSG